MLKDKTDFYEKNSSLVFCLGSSILAPGSGISQSIRVNTA